MENLLGRETVFVKLNRNDFWIICFGGGKQKTFLANSFSERKGLLSQMPARKGRGPGAHRLHQQRQGYALLALTGSFISQVSRRKMKVVLKEFALAMDKGRGKK